LIFRRILLKECAFLRLYIYIYIVSTLQFRASRYIYTLRLSIHVYYNVQNIIHIYYLQMMKTMIEAYKRHFFASPPVRVNALLCWFIVVDVILYDYTSTTITILRRNGPQFFWHFIIYIYIPGAAPYLLVFLVSIHIYANTISYNTRKKWQYYSKTYITLAHRDCTFIKTLQCCTAVMDFMSAV